MGLGLGRYMHATGSLLYRSQTEWDWGWAGTCMQQVVTVQKPNGMGLGLHRYMHATGSYCTEAKRDGTGAGQVNGGTIFMT